MKYEFYEKIQTFRKELNNSEVMEVLESLGVAATVRLRSNRRWNDFIEKEGSSRLGDPNGISV